MPVTFEIIVQILGWSGVVLYVTAYYLLLFGRISLENFLFHMLNNLGAVGLIVDAAYHRDMPNLVVNVLWLAIGCVAIARSTMNRMNNKL